MFTALIAVMVAHVYTYPQTHRAACLKYVQISTSQTYLTKFFFILKRKHVTQKVMHQNIISN